MTTNTEALRLARDALTIALHNAAAKGWATSQTAAAIAAIDAALAQQTSAEPDMRHPKIQALIGGKARREIELRLVEQLLDDPDCDLSAMEMEYWHGLHDKLREKLLAAQPAPAPATQPGWVLVPAEATPAMCKAAVIFANGSAVYTNVAAEALKIEEAIYGEAYAAMIAAVTPPQADQ